MCGDNAAEDEESDYSDDLVCAEEVTASTRQEEDKAGSCSDLLLASSPDSSLPVLQIAPCQVKSRLYLIQIVPCQVKSRL